MRESWPTRDDGRKLGLPLVLNIEGSEASLALFERLPDRGLGVVGTRHPSGRSLLETSRCLRELAGSGLVIVSGFARGIDAAAHEGALRNGLPTIAFVGAGLDVDYPIGHGPLRRAIVEAGGLLVSELAPDAPPRAGHFHQRNRLIAAASKAVWVVEAGRSSGALVTAKHARNSERAVYATPCYPGDPALVGNQNLIDAGGAVPLWGAHTLGSTWIPLAARPERGGLAGDPASAWLLAEIRRLTCERGGAWSTELLDRFLLARKGQSPREFFETVDSLVSESLVADRGGVLVSSPARRDASAPEDERPRADRPGRGAARPGS